MFTAMISGCNGNSFDTASNNSGGVMLGPCESPKFEDMASRLLAPFPAHAFL